MYHIDKWILYVTHTDIKRWNISIDPRKSQLLPPHPYNHCFEICHLRLVLRKF